MTRIAIGGIEHETNTYARGFTPKRAFSIMRGAKMMAAAGQHSAVGGAIDACLARDIDAVPLVHAVAQPSGIIERSAHEDLRDELLDRLADAGPVDGIVLLLHGAGVADGYPDIEADITTAVRQQVGDDVPIAAVFDLHGNVTQAMADQLNGVFACHQYPHVDFHHRADEAVALVAELASSERRSRCTIRNVPMLMPTTTTYGGPAKAFLQRVLAEEADRDMIDVSWFHGFPYTDVAHVGSTLCVTSYNSADDVVDALAEELWSRREDFRAQSLSAEQAIARALELSSQVQAPVVINETSDNCGAGSPGDGTHLLRAMLTAGLGNRACFGFIVDPTSAERAIAAGVGSTVELTLGGYTDDLHGAPLEVTAYVKAISDGRLTLTHMLRGMPLNIGPVVRLVIDGMDVIVASRRSQTFDLEPFRCVGIEVSDYEIVALKSSQHFRACFEEVAGAIVTADPPGLSTLHVEIFPRQSTNRRFWPSHDDAVFPETGSDRV